MTMKSEIRKWFTFCALLPAAAGIAGAQGFNELEKKGVEKTLAIMVRYG